MKQEDIKQLFQQFEQVASISSNVKCWSARELCELKGYNQWHNLLNVIENAKETCKNAGNGILDHFANIIKMIEKNTYITYFEEKTWKPWKYIT